MSVVQRSLRQLGYRSSLVLVFVTALTVAVCAGAVVAFTPDVWVAVAVGANVTTTEMQIALTGGGLGFFSGLLPGLIADKLTPMLAAFFFSGGACLGWFLLFWVSRGDLHVAWPLLGLFFFIVGQSCIGMVTLGLRMVAHNAPRSRRGFISGSIIAAVGAGMLLWQLLFFAVFGNKQDSESWYLLSLAIAVPLFFFLSAFSLHQVEKPHAMVIVAEEHFAPNLNMPPLFESETTSDDVVPGFVDDSDIGFRTDEVEEQPMLTPDDSGAVRRTRLSHICLGLSMGLVVASSALLLWIEAHLLLTTPLSSSTSYLYPGAMLCSALMTGFFSDFALRFPRPAWLLLAGLAGALAHILTVLYPIEWWFGQQVIQGGALGASLTAGISHLSLVFGVARLGLTSGLVGVWVGVCFVALVAFYTLTICATRYCVFYFAAAFSFVGGLLGGLSALFWRSGTKSEFEKQSRVHHAEYEPIINA